MHARRDKSSTIRKDGRATGFTLLEIVIVVAIVAILVAILLPSLSRVRQMSVRVVCQANLQGIGTAVGIYSMDYNFDLPTYYADPDITFDTFRMRTDSEKIVNLGCLLDYGGDPKLFYCPSQDGSTSPSIAYDTPENRWRDGTASGGSGGRGGGRTGGDKPRKPGPRPGVNSSYTVRFRKLGDGHASVWNNTNHTNKVIYSDFIGVDDWPGRGRFANRICSPHHGRGYNRLFGDGSALWADANPVNAQRPLSSSEPTADELYQYFLLLDVLR